MHTRFQGDFFALGESREGLTWEDLSMEEFIMRDAKFLEGNARLSSIIFKKMRK